MASDSYRIPPSWAQVDGPDGSGPGSGVDGSGFGAGEGFSEGLEEESPDEPWDGVDASLLPADALPDVEAMAVVGCSAGTASARICPRNPVTAIPAFVTFSMVVRGLPSSMPLLA